MTCWNMWAENRYFSEMSSNGEATASNSKMLPSAKQIGFQRGSLASGAR